MTKSRRTQAAPRRKRSTDQALHAAIVKTAREAQREAMHFLRDCQNIDLNDLSDVERQDAVNRLKIAERVLAAYHNAKTDEKLEAAMELHSRLLPAEVERCVRQIARRVTKELSSALQAAQAAAERQASRRH